MSFRSRRTISLDPTTVEVLHAHRVVQDQERATAGEAWDPSYDLVLCDGTGRPEHPDRLGHATIVFTIDTYSHVAPSLDAAAADTVAADIFGSSA